MTRDEAETLILDFVNASAISRQADRDRNIPNAMKYQRQNEYRQAYSKLLNALCQPAPDHVGEGNGMIPNQGGSSPDLNFEEFLTQIKRSTFIEGPQYQMTSIRLDGERIKALYERMANHSADANKMVEDYLQDGTKMILEAAKRELSTMERELRDSGFCGSPTPYPPDEDIKKLKAALKAVGIKEG